MNDNTDNVISLAAAKEGRFNNTNNNNKKESNMQPVKTEEKAKPCKFKVNYKDGHSQEVEGYLGLYPEFIIFGDGEGAARRVIHGNEWIDIENLGDVDSVAVETPPTEIHVED